MTRTTLAVALLGLSLAGCRGDDNNNNNSGVDAPPGDGTIPGGEVTIQQIQNDSMAPGTPVEVKGVVVTAIDAYGNRTGDLWVQEPGGGPFSGIKVFGAPLDQLATLAPGDIVDITGVEKDEFALTTDVSGRTVTEIKPIGGGMMTITKMGTGSVPAPATVDALAVSQMAQAAQDAEWEKWEGVLITVTNALQTTDVASFGSNPGPDSKEFEITGGVAVQSVLTDLGTSAVANTCYAGITGIGDYFFNYLLLPRSTADLVTGGTGCETATAATISDIQAGTATGLVQLTDVYVSAVGFSRKNLWVSTSLTAGPNEGIYIYRGGGAAVLDSGVVPGAKVDIVGTAVEGNNDQMGDTLTQITGATVTVKAAPTAPPVAVAGKTASELLVASTGEPYESVLVTLTNVKVTTLGTSTNFYVSDLTQSGTAFKADDDIYRLVTADMNACYATITGIWTYNLFDNVYMFLPLGPGTGTGVCN